MTKGKTCKAKKKYNKKNVNDALKKKFYEKKFTNKKLKFTGL